MTEPVVLVNAFGAPAGQAGRFIAAWEASRGFRQSRPGRTDTAPHQALAPGADFPLVNIARWRPAGAFTAATRSPGSREPAAGLAGYRRRPGPYRVSGRNAAQRPASPGGDQGASRVRSQAQ